MRSHLFFISLALLTAGYVNAECPVTIDKATSGNPASVVYTNKSDKVVTSVTIGVTPEKGTLLLKSDHKTKPGKTSTLTSENPALSAKSLTFWVDTVIFADKSTWRDTGSRECKAETAVANKKADTDAGPKK